MKRLSLDTVMIIKVSLAVSELRAEDYVMCVGGCVYPEGNKRRFQSVCRESLDFLKFVS